MNKRIAVVAVAILIIAVGGFIWYLLQMSPTVNPNRTVGGPAASCKLPSASAIAAGASKVPTEIIDPDGQLTGEMISGTLKSGQTQTGTLTIDTADRVAIYLIWHGDNMSLDYPSPTYEAEVPTYTFTLCSPSGELVTPDASYRNGSAFEPTVLGPQYYVFNPEPGEWQAIVHVDYALDKGATFIVGIAFAGGVQINPTTAADISPAGQPLTITAAISDTHLIAGAMVGASVTPEDGSLKQPIIFPLIEQQPGIYQGVFTPTIEGVYSADVKATGTDNQGHHFDRIESIAFNVAASGSLVPSSAEAMGSFEEQAIDHDGNGKFDALVLSTTVDIKEKGMYQIRGTLNSATDKGLSYSVGYYRLKPGRQQIAFSFAGGDLATADGPYKLSQLVFSRMSTSDEITLANVYDAYTTHPYSAAQWEGQPRTQANQFGTGDYLEPSGSDSASVLSVNIPLSVTHASTYTISARLALPNPPAGIDPTITYASQKDVKIDRSGGYAVLRFSGPDIRAKGLDGPYVVDMLTFTDAEGKSELINGGKPIATTTNYFSDEFAAK